MDEEHKGEREHTIVRYNNELKHLKYLYYRLYQTSYISSVKMFYLYWILEYW